MQASVPRLLRSDAAQLRPVASLALIVMCLIIQVFLPLHVRLAGFVDLPLLAVVYLAVDQRQVVSGLLTGAGIGLAQDALTHGPIGLFGIINTIIGYLAASVSLVVEVTYPGARALLTALCFLLHDALFWGMRQALLGTPVELNLTRSLLLAAAHGGLALFLFRILDRFKRAR